MNLGYSHPVEINSVDGIIFEVPNQTQIIVSGIDKQLVGEVANAKLDNGENLNLIKEKGLNILMRL